MDNLGIRHLYTLQSNHPDKSRKHLTPYGFTIFMDSIHYAAFYIWMLSFQNVLLYQISTGDRPHSALTHNIKGTVYITSIAQCQILISELDWKRKKNMKATFLYNKYKGRLTWTTGLHSKECASVRVSDRTRRTQDNWQCIAGCCSWILQKALLDINEGLECMEVAG